MKGFVTLEYVLLLASVITILGSVVFGIVSLYNRNISAIDNSRFSDFCKDLKTRIELFEIMPEGKIEIESNNLEPWGITKIGNGLKINNLEKTCEIRTSLSVSLGVLEISRNQKLTLTKQNNTLNIN